MTTPAGQQKRGNAREAEERDEVNRGPGGVATDTQALYEDALRWRALVAVWRVLENPTDVIAGLVDAPISRVSALYAAYRDKEG